MVNIPEEELALIDRITKVLESCPQSIDLYKSCLESLSPIVVRTAEDETYRKELASSFIIWKQLKTTIDGCIIDRILKLGNEDYNFWYLRTVRALLLLMRNLSVNNQEIPQEILLQNSILRLFQIICDCHFSYGDMETSTYVTAISFLHNISKKSVIFDKTIIDSLMIFLQYPINHPKKQHDMLYPFVLYFLNLTENEEFLYYFFRQESKDKILYEFLIKQLLKEHSTISRYIREREDESEQREMSTMDSILLKCFTKICTHESFAPYLLEVEKKDTEEFMYFMEILQLAITSSERWDNFQLTGIMAWLIKLFEAASKDVEEYFKKNEENDEVATILHKKLRIILDMLSVLSQYEHVQKFLLHYKGLEILINMLKLFQDNLLRVNFNKDKFGSVKDVRTTDALGTKVNDVDKLETRVDYDNFKIKPTNFPECKLLIIEILSNLTFKNTEVQDKMRTLHGLELVLSNCVIDDNDPFIKERSIICIKFLLENNEANQSLVSQLEAKKPVQDDVLEKAGYDVKIEKGGEIKLVPKEQEKDHAE
ncbi:hypothetical protein KAFR_0J02540 [Kazachstania africana CBS 2517]|uniref:Ataxin-10 homolog n=1 Tax=Kazachstania africana (strain ATCC 22294 / BCRC 22015 / CBS 2517 / CECT 1963 / NBRC 1671 / NRRL Y-8276) TaxID=1071382 RepID=H2B118_KAZAF|nr:hypothetical protein KAFR_0J02540 [Kazachstania africana CBS 2517]CCF60318.1 hypothetical protein KAFR_0J02540 [Kazachstania africana CBS 2517]